MSFCPKCGTQIPEGANACPNCGQNLTAAPSGLSIQIIKNVFGVLSKKPIMLLGISLLCTLLTFVAGILGGPVPLIGFALGLVLELGMAWIYLDGYRGQEVKVDSLFDGFKNFKRSFCVMGWRKLVVFLWTIVPMVLGGIVAYIFCKAVFSQLLGNLKNLIFGGLGRSSYYGYSYGYGGYDFDDLMGGMPSGVITALLVIGGIVLVGGIITGFVFYCIKTYTYSVVPYIIRDDNETKPLDVARKSANMTNGYKGKMFLTDLLIVICIAIVNGLLSALGYIPGVGFLFTIIATAVSVLIGLFTPLFFGLVRAAWYVEITKNR